MNLRETLANPSFSTPATIRVLLPDGSVVPMALEEYLRGVLPTEMGHKSPLEALKAQAVAARCYASTTSKHDENGADLCTTTHCQAWSPTHYPETDRAVAETEGVVAAYDRQIINAVYFAQCDGRTRHSEEVWGGMAPYLRSVSCSCGHQVLKGHGVGLCQRGAMAIAEAGANYQDILRHYYTGISLEQTGEAPVAREELGLEPEFEAMAETTATTARPTQARLVTPWMSEADAAAWLDYFAQYPDYHGLFQLEKK